MLLIWLMHFDNRWCWKKSIPFFNYFWILTAIIKFIQTTQSIDQTRNLLLLSQVYCSILMHHQIAKKKNQKNIKQYKNRVDVTKEMTQWVYKKVLKTLHGQIAFVVALLDIFWIYQDIFAFINVVTVLLTLGAFFIIKISALILSWAYPELYRKLKRKIK